MVTAKSEALLMQVMLENERLASPVGSGNVLGSDGNGGIAAT